MKQEQEIPNIERKSLELLFNILLIVNSFTLCYIIGITAAFKLEPYTKQLIKIIHNIL